MINHGLSTGGLFAVVGMIYERYHTRQIADLGGLARRLPLLSFFFLLFTFFKHWPARIEWVCRRVPGVERRIPTRLERIAGDSWLTVALDRGVVNVRRRAGCLVYVAPGLADVSFGPLKEPVADHGPISHGFSAEKQRSTRWCLIHRDAGQGEQRHDALHESSAGSDHGGAGNHSHADRPPLPPGPADLRPRLNCWPWRLWYSSFSGSAFIQNSSSTTCARR